MLIDPVTPPVELPVWTAIQPEFPDPDIPVESCNEPEFPCDQAAELVTTTLPEPADWLLPEEIVTPPPRPVAREAPADNTIPPATPELLLPTMRLTAPADPPVEAPLVTCTHPVLPEEAAPVRMPTPPVVPLVCVCPDCSNTLPEPPLELDPDRITTVPPDPGPDIKPPVALMSPPGFTV